MKAEGNNGGYRIVAEINMVPFIDVVLVLLIIFMVMTPFLMRAQIKVNLPAAGQVEAADERESIIVQVDTAGEIFIEGAKVPPGEIVASLRRRLNNPKTQSLQIEADRDASFQHVVVVLDAGKKSGFAKMGVCVKPSQRSR